MKKGVCLEGNTMIPKNIKLDIPESLPLKDGFTDKIIGTVTNIEWEDDKLIAKVVFENDEEWKKIRKEQKFLTVTLDSLEQRKDGYTIIEDAQLIGIHVIPKSQMLKEIEHP